MPDSKGPSSSCSTPGLRSRLRKFLLRVWWRRRWTILAASWLLTLILGYIGFSAYASLAGLAHSPRDTLELTLQLFTMRSGAGLEPRLWVLQIARLLAPAVAALTTIRTLSILFSDQYHALRLATVRNHAIIAGLGRKGSSLARMFLADGIPVVVIDENRDNPRIRSCKDQGALVLIGDATNPETLLHAGLHRATVLIADVGCDTDNARIAIQTRMRTHYGRHSPLTVFTHLEDPDLTALLVAQGHWAAPNGALRLEYYNVYANGSRVLLAEFPPRGATPAAPLGPTPHLLIVGYGRLGRALLLRAARIWHDSRIDGSARLQVTVVDRNAQEKGADQAERYPDLADACDCTFHQMNVTSAAFRQSAFLYGPDGRLMPTAIYVCLGDEALGMLTGLNLWEHTRGSGIPVVIRASTALGLAGLTQTLGDALTTAELRVFSLEEAAYRPERLLNGTLETIARSIHEAYVAQQNALGHSHEDNPSVVPWDELPPLLQESNRDQARHICTKLGALGYVLTPLTNWEPATFRFSDSEVELLAEAEHVRFVAERQRAMGTRRAVPAEFKSKMAHTLIPWTDLTETEREKDRSAVRNLPIILARVGLQITPIREEQSDETQNSR